MVKNVGTIDRIIRIVVACALVFLAATPAVNGWLAYVFIAAAIYIGLTAIIGHCLVYRMLDVDSHVHGGTYHSGEDPFDGRLGN